LPGAVFAYQKSQFGYIVAGLVIEYDGIFYGHLVCFVVIWYILWPFGMLCGQLVYFMAIWYVLWTFGIFLPVLVCCTKKNLATGLSENLRNTWFDMVRTSSGPSSIEI
jgi:hypothetical protein